MATKAPVTTEETVEETVAEPTTKSLISEGIVKVIEATGIDVQKNRYKAMRAIAFQAFQEAIDAGDFDALVARAIKNIDSLPAGWEIERLEKNEIAAPAKAAPAKAAVKAAPTKAPAKTATKAAPAKTAAAPRKRPTR